jgi:hypothetical protein
MVFFLSARERSWWGHLGNLTVEISKDVWEPIGDRKIWTRIDNMDGSDLVPGWDCIHGWCSARKR